MCNFCASVTKQNCKLFLSLKYFIFHLWWCPYPNVSLSCILTQNTQQKKKKSQREEPKEMKHLEPKQKWMILKSDSPTLFCLMKCEWFRSQPLCLFFPSLLLQSYWHSFLLGLNDNLSNPSVTQSLYDLPFTHIYTNGMLNFG